MKDAVKVFPCGREVCDKTTSGLRLYRNRTLLMMIRQNYLCALCGMFMQSYEATFDHEDGRGMGGGKRDDRIEVDGKWKNAAVHGSCNGAKGSRKIPYVIEQQVGA